MIDTGFGVDDKNSLRIITGTKDDIDELVMENKFRRELYHQLDTFFVTIKPLRNRKSEIYDLVRFIVNYEVEMNHLNPISFDKEIVDKLEDYSWPGNLIEMQQAIRTAIVKCSSNKIKVNDLPKKIVEKYILRTKRGPALKLNVDMVKDALVKTDGNKAKAAKLLGVGRATLYRFLGSHSELDFFIN